jgi:antitoxin ParD1/3/4
VKLSVSLPAEDVEFLDAYAASHGIASRSAAVGQAVQALRESELRGAYEQAFAEWEDSEDAALWERTVADGV